MERGISFDYLKLRWFFRAVRSISLLIERQTTYDRGVRQDITQGVPKRSAILLRRDKARDSIYADDSVRAEMIIQDVVRCEELIRRTI